MSSITGDEHGKKTIDAIIAKGGGDVKEILTYNNIFNGGLTYKLIYRRDDADYIRNNIAGSNVTSIWRKS